MNSHFPLKMWKFSPVDVLPYMVGSCNEIFGPHNTWTPVHSFLKYLHPYWNMHPQRMAFCGDFVLFYGFWGSSFDLLCSCLSDRWQRVLFHGELSEWGAVSIGIPQGSILDPLLFALYINDLPSVITHCYLDLYGDECVIMQSYIAVIQICVLWRTVCSQT